MSHLSFLLRNYQSTGFLILLVVYNKKNLQLVVYANTSLPVLSLPVFFLSTSRGAGSDHTRGNKTSPFSGGGGRSLGPDNDSVHTLGSLIEWKHSPSERARVIITRSCVLYQILSPNPSFPLVITDLPLCHRGRSVLPGLVISPVKFIGNRYLITTNGECGRRFPMYQYTFLLRRRNE